MSKILIVEDDTRIRKLLKITLNACGYTTVESGSAKEAMAEFAKAVPDLVLLDLGLPDCNGKELISELRSFSEVPIIILTAVDEEQDKIESFELGADDYVTKPFSSGELTARINAVIRRTQLLSGEKVIIECGSLKINLAERRITRGESEVHLTPKEFNILKCLASNLGRVVTHEKLLRDAWGKLYKTEGQYIRVFVNRLRKKIEPHGERKLIVTEPGIGYRFCCDET